MKRVVAALAALLVAGSAAAQTSEFKPIGSGKWTILMSVDAMTDKGRGIAALDGEGRNSLVVKCDASGEGVRRMYLSWISPEYLGSVRNDYREVMYRFDTDPPQTGSWFHNGRTANLMREQDVPAFISRLMKAQKLALRATTFQHETVNATFDVSGSSEAIVAAYKACGNTPPE